MVRVVIVLGLTVAVSSSVPLVMVSYVVSVKTMQSSGGYWLLLVLAAAGIGAKQGQQLAHSLIRKAIVASIVGMFVAALVAVIRLALIIPIIGE